MRTENRDIPPTKTGEPAKLKVTTLGIPTPNRRKFPDGCPILKALKGRAGERVNKAVAEACEIDEWNPEMILLPTDLGFYLGADLSQAESICRAGKLPVMAFSLAKEIPKPAWVTHIVRASWHRGEAEPGNIICPPVAPGTGGAEWPPKTDAARWQPLPKGEIPSVGFCGRTGSEPCRTLWKMIPRAVTRWMGTKPLLGRTKGFRGLCGAPLRKDALEHLSTLAAKGAIKLDATDRKSVIHRPSTQGGAKEKFHENLRDNQFSLCSRGSENYSFRFYETLAAGRIPVLIDTGCILPLEDEIDWDRLIVRVPCREIPAIGKKIKDFHGALSPEEFVSLQKEILEISEKLRPENFFPKMLQKLARH